MLRGWIVSGIEQWVWMGYEEFCVEGYGVGSRLGIGQWVWGVTRLGVDSVPDGGQLDLIK